MALEQLPPDRTPSLRDKLIQRLPPALQDRVTHFETHHLPTLQSQTQSSLKGTLEFLAPLWAELRIIIGNFRRKVATAGPSSSVGNTFRHLCFVGLNRSELLLAGESQPVFNDSWTDLAGENIKRHTALMFFAPRGLDGKPVNPYLFLVGEGTMEDSDLPDPAAVALAEQTVGPLALLDLCRIPPAAPNTVNILLVADTLFHWDIKDNYVLPTSPTSWVRDLEQVIKSYPRTTRANIYTQWDTDAMPPTERMTFHSLRDFPLEDATWLNKPTLQERFGGHMLAFGIVMAVCIYAGLWYQGRQLQELTDQLNVVEQQIPRGGQFSDLERGIAEQEKMWAKRDLFGLVVKDTARAIQKSGIKILSFETRVADVDEPPVNYIVTIDVKPDAYQGWLQQEPIARSLILNSAVLDAIRKPPTTTGFKLEAMVSAAGLARDFKPFASQFKVMPQAVSETTPEKTAAVLPTKNILPQFTTRTAPRAIEPAAGNTPASMPEEGTE